VNLRAAVLERAAARESAGPSSVQASWFGPFDPAVAEGESGLVGRLDPAGEGEDDAAAPQAGNVRVLPERASREGGAGSLQRLHGAFLTARAGIGLMLLAIQALAWIGGMPSRTLVVALCGAYAVQALIVSALPRARRLDGSGAGRLSRTQTLATIGTDLVVFALLHVWSEGSSLNYTALLGLPVLMAGVLAHKSVALATAAAATMVLIGDAGWTLALGRETATLLTQAALLGGGFFVMALLASEMAARIAREERTARGNLEAARQQAQLNRLVLEEMQDGVLVVDRNGRVRAANPSARTLLAASGACRPAPFQLQGVQAWQPLVLAVERAFGEGHWPEGGRDVGLSFGPVLQRTLRVRVRFTRRREAATSEEFCVLFVEDLRHVQERLRQEKLAAMGRISAGIAHEIRNPLAAISQANALLSEDSTEPSQQRLTQMVADNVERLKRIVDDVMEVAAGDAPDAVVIDATTTARSVCSEWAVTAGLHPGAHSPLTMELGGSAAPVHFDPEHLRRVMVNLLDNALRHSSGGPAAVRLWLAAPGPQVVELGVASDGPPIAAEVERYLFEPFFSTRSRGTGLGLYICRELCERYGATINFKRRPEGVPHRNVFVVQMRRASPERDQPASLSP
jgi:two-component system, NtrC family, sensor histidine kinase PilS